MRNQEVWRVLQGRCECAAVRFEVNGPVEEVCHCHCSQCRRLHGAAYATFAGVARADFRLLRGTEAIREYASSDSNLRAFCGTCGSTLYVDASTEPDARYLALSTLEGVPELPVAYHQYVASKAPWHEIDDALEKFEGSAP